MTAQLPLFPPQGELEQRDATLLALGYPGYVPKTDHGRMLQAQYRPKAEPTFARPLKPANASVSHD